MLYLSKQTLNIDVNSLQPVFVDHIQSSADDGVRELVIKLTANGSIVSLENSFTATAAISINNALITDDLSCTIDATDNTITIAIDNKYFDSAAGIMAVQPSVSDGTRTLTIPRPIYVRVEGTVAETAQIHNNSLGSYAEVVQEIAAARGTYTTLAAALASKLDAADGAVKTANLDAGAVTTAKVADAAVTTAKIADNSVTAGKLSDDVKSEIDKIGTKMNAGRVVASTDESTLVSGYYYDFNTKSTYETSSGRYRQLTGVQSGDRFLCSGRTHGSYKYAFYGFLDGNGDVIMTYAPTLNTAYTDVEIVAPANAATLIVNGSTSYPPSIKRVTYDVDAFNDFVASVNAEIANIDARFVSVENTTQSKLNAKADTQVFDNYAYETPAQIHEGYMKAANASITASATGRAYEYAVTPTNVLVCHGRSAASGATYPAFIFLDANRSPIGSYGSSNSTTYNETLIIPAGCAYLVINGTTNVSYTPNCYKRVYKSRPFNLSAAKNLRNIAARNPFVFSTSEFGDHGIVTFVFDDGHEDLDSICSIFEEYNYPVCLAIPPETLKKKCTELTAARGSFTVGMSVKQVCDVVVANGGEIMTHHFTPVTSALQYDYDFMLDKYYTGKIALENAGYTVRGFIKAGGTGTVVRTPELEAWLNGNYEYSDSGIQLNYNLTRTNINQSLSDLETLINSCAANKTWLRFMGHYYTTGGGTTFTGESDLRAILGYCQTAGVEVATYATVFDRYS